MATRSTVTPALVYSLAEGVDTHQADGAVVVQSPYFQITIPNLSPAAQQTMIDLAEKPHSEDQIDGAILDSDGLTALAEFYSHLPSLAQHQVLHFQPGNGNGRPAIATLIPISLGFGFVRAPIQVDKQYRLSRFAYLRRDEDTHCYLESPLAHARIRLDQPVAATVVYLLGTGTTPPALVEATGWDEEGAIYGLLSLLLMGGFVEQAQDDGRFFEENDETLMQWDFHDLLFHSRSRTGRHNNRIGGSFRFLNRIAPQPAVKQAQWGTPFLPLPHPDMAMVRATDPSLTAVMDARASIRTFGSTPITVNQLGEFLYRVARVKKVFSIDDKGDFTKRPYPSGGASYELELYLTVDQCVGLAPGFYWYDPLNHGLHFVSERTADVQGFLYEAYQATAGLCWPQVLITLAARFQRVSWKYDSMAYATILKNAGVLYATMYLVATAMCLAPCGLGTGNSDRFARVAGTDYLKETSVGEFILGSGPT